MLTIRRLDFTNTITAMLTVACRHAARLEGASQRALDDITEHLHTIDRLIATHRLADALNGPIPHQVGEEDEDDAALSLDDEPEIPPASAPRSPKRIFPDLTAHDPKAPSKLTPSQAAVLDYIRTNPGCTGAEISAATGRGLPSVQTAITVIRKITPVHATRQGGKNGASHYRIGT